MPSSTATTKQKAYLRGRLQLLERGGYKFFSEGIVIFQVFFWRYRIGEVETDLVTWMFFPYKKQSHKESNTLEEKSFTVFLLSLRDLQFYWSMCKHSFFEPRMKKAVDAIAVVAIYWLLDDKEGFIRRSTLSKMQRLQNSPQLQRASQLRANWRKTPFISIQNEAL